MLEDFPKIEARDGKIFLDDDTYYDTLADYIQQHVLEWCACGQPDENLLYIRGGLRLIAEKYESPEGDWEAWYKEHRRKVDEHFKSQQGEYFFYYWCAAHDLTEHGGSVPGWLDSKGEELLALLDELGEEEECENVDAVDTPE